MSQVSHNGADADDQRGEAPAGGERDAEAGERNNLLVPGLDRWPIDPDRPIIELVDVYKAFGDEQVLDGLSLRIVPGEITVIMGASGSGKTVLIKHMNGLLVPDKGRVCLFDHDTQELGDVELDRQRKRIGTLFQNYALFDSMSAVDNVAFPLVENQAMSIAKARERAAEILEDLGLGHALDVFPASLSGGMKKRVSLARAIIANPEVVLFDEPTTGLDPIMMEFVDDMILDISERYELTSVIISHDIASAMRLADTIAVLHEGRIIAHGSPAQVRQSDDDAVQQLLSGSTKSDISADTAASASFGQDIDYPVRASGVYKAFGDNEVLKGVSFSVPKHKITVLIGASGSGKSVMMKHILGLFQPDQGTVEVFGRDLGELSERQLRELRTQIGMLFQHAALFDSMTVADNVAFPLVERGLMTPAEAREPVADMLERLRLKQVADSPPSDLSTGQQKRVSLARALITEPELMIYDEPTTGQDPILSKYVENMILEAQEAFEVTSIVISHDMAQTFRIADKVAVLHEGEIIAEGPPASLLESEDERVREFVFASDVSRKKREESD
jgi:ABC-type transporter Mla maintaining outer membrane lipid asymmetry ATPase subunit MlaF